MLVAIKECPIDPMLPDVDREELEEYFDEELDPDIGDDNAEHD